MIRIPVMRPRLASFEEVAPLLRRMDQSHIYSNRGPLVLELEEEYSQYLKVEKELVVALSNATQAIQGLISISKNDDWVVPDYTFSATGLAVLNANRRLLLCDVSAIDWKLDTDVIEKEHAAFGIVPVMPFGSEINFEPYKNFEDVIIDAAASLGSVPPNFNKMRDSWAVVYSLHATKVLSAGEGAIVVCGNHAQADSLRAWSNFGFSSGRASEIQGTNAKMSEMNAAYGLVSIRKINFERSNWLESQQMVSDYSRGRSWFTRVNHYPSFQPYWIADFETEKKRQYIEEVLNNFGVQSRCWWSKPLSKQNGFKANTTVIGSVNNSDSLASRHLGLPMFLGLGEKDIRFIIDTIDESLHRFNKLP